MGGFDAGYAAAGEIAQMLQQQQLIAVVEPGYRFVENENAGALAECTGNQNQLLFAAADFGVGAVGQVFDAESGHGSWPWVRFKVDQLICDQQRQRRLERAHPLELNYAI